MANKCNLVCKTKNVVKNAQTPSGRKAIQTNAVNWVLSVPPFSVLRWPRLALKTGILFKKLSKS